MDARASRDAPGSEDAQGSEDERLGRAPIFEDARGRLTLVPYDELPFTPARVYVLGEIPDGARRAGHACRTQHRFLVGLSGRGRVTLDDGYRNTGFDLTRGDTVHVPPATWHEIEAVGNGLAILVLADGAHDPADYVDDRAELALLARTAAQTAET